MLNDEGRRARLHYFSGSYRLLAPGDYVVCAVSGARIPLAQLKYWNADVQEAYASSAIATRRAVQLREQAPR